VRVCVKVRQQVRPSPPLCCSGPHHFHLQQPVYNPERGAGVCVCVCVDMTHCHLSPTHNVLPQWVQGRLVIYLAARSSPFPASRFCRGVGEGRRRRRRWWWGAGSRSRR
jgi:hypothetical protein